jgi:endo-1,4-beta-D-glucanase Y
MRAFVTTLAIVVCSTACGSAADDPATSPGNGFTPAGDPDAVAANDDTGTTAADAVGETTNEDTGEAPAVDAGTDTAPPTKPGEPSHPFGGHVFKYAAGSILPSLSGLDAKTASFYDAWKSKYLVAGCGAGRYYVSVGGGGGGGMSGGSIVVSEGQGYGMLVAVLMAGHDPDARTIYDGLYAFFRDHPSIHSKDLMAWNQVTGCKDSPDGGNDSATDGDLDIALSLLLADKQWGSTGKVDYLAEGKKVIAAIGAHEMNATTHLALLGDWAEGDAKFGNGTRPSDFMIDHFRAYGAASGDAVWKSVVDAHWSAVAAIQSGYSSKSGLLPDFATASTASAAKPVSGTYLEGATDGTYSWNACRVPWRLGTDFLVSGDARAKTAVDKINGWIRSSTAEDPSKIVDGYALDGTKKGSANEIAFLAPFGVAAMSDAKNQAWLDAIWKRTEATKIGGGDYYGDTIKLLTMIVMSGNYWTP